MEVIFHDGECKQSNREDFGKLKQPGPEPYTAMRKILAGRLIDATKKRAAHTSACTVEIGSQPQSSLKSSWCCHLCIPLRSIHAKLTLEFPVVKDSSQKTDTHRQILIFMLPHKGCLQQCQLKPKSVHLEK
jgi:hypothetical protein